MKTKIQVIVLLTAAVSLCGCQSSSPRTPVAAPTKESPPPHSGATVTWTRDVIIDIDGYADILMGGEKATLTSLREYFDSRHPTRVVVRSKASTTISLKEEMTTFLEHYGLREESKLGNEALWIVPASVR